MYIYVCVNIDILILILGIVNAILRTYVTRCV